MLHLTRWAHIYTFIIEITILIFNFDMHAIGLLCIFGCCSCYSFITKRWIGEKLDSALNEWIDYALYGISNVEDLVNLSIHFVYDYGFYDVYLFQACHWRFNRQTLLTCVIHLFFPPLLLSFLHGEFGLRRMRSLCACCCVILNFHMSLHVFLSETLTLINLHSFDWHSWIGADITINKYVHMEYFQLSNRCCDK